MMQIENSDLFGLKQRTINQINNVFVRYRAVKQAILYGSRAKGSYRQGSDIDLTLIGESLSYNDLLKIASDIDDLLLPYKIDLSLYHQINNPDLKAHIDRVGQFFYTAYPHNA